MWNYLSVEVLRSVYKSMDFELIPRCTFSIIVDIKISNLMWGLSSSISVLEK